MISNFVEVPLDSSIGDHSHQLFLILDVVFFSLIYFNQRQLISYKFSKLKHSANSDDLLFLNFIPLWKTAALNSSLILPYLNPLFSEFQKDLPHFSYFVITIFSWGLFFFVIENLGNFAVFLLSDFIPFYLWFDHPSLLVYLSSLINDSLEKDISERNIWGIFRNILKLQRGNKTKLD